MNPFAFLLTICLAAASLPVSAQTEAENVPEQRERINLARARYDTQFRAQEIACYQRFAVNDCLAENRRIEREVMADLRRQEILLNDAQRKRRAAQQLLRTDERLHGGPQQP